MSSVVLFNCVCPSVASQSVSSLLHSHQLRIVAFQLHSAGSIHVSPVDSALQKSSTHCGVLITPTLVDELPIASETFHDSAAHLADWIKCLRTDDESWLVQTIFCRIALARATNLICSNKATLMLVHDLSINSHLR